MVRFQRAVWGHSANVLGTLVSLMGLVRFSFSFGSFPTGDINIYIYIYIYIYIVTNTTIGWLAKKYNRWGTFLFLIIFLQNLYNYILKSMSLHRLYNIYPTLRNIRYTLFGVTQWSNDLCSCKSSTVRWQSPNGNEVYMTPNGPG